MGKLGLNYPVLLGSDPGELIPACSRVYPSTRLYGSDCDYQTDATNFDETQLVAQLTIRHCPLASRQAVPYRSVARLLGPCVDLYSLQYWPCALIQPRRGV
jgi:hypothetical protein